MRAPFADRREAGQVLAATLRHYAGQPDVLMLGLPRGGMPVACEVALSLGAPVDVVVVRKRGVPGHDAVAIGASASGGVRVLHPYIRARDQARPAVLIVADAASARLFRYANASPASPQSIHAHTAEEVPVHMPHELRLGLHRLERIAPERVLERDGLDIHATDAEVRSGATQNARAEEVARAAAQGLDGVGDVRARLRCAPAS